MIEAIKKAIVYLLLLGAIGYAVYTFVDWPAPAPAPKPRPRPFRPFRLDEAKETLPSILESVPTVETAQLMAGAEGREAHWFGYTPDPQGTQTFVQSLDTPNIRAANPALFGDDKPVLLYRYLYEAYREYSGGQQWIVGKQGIGDCVSWGWAHGVDIVTAIDFVEGESGEWKPAATEAIYGGSRVEARGRSSGGWSDGSYGAAAAKWLVDYGVLWRQPYEKFDLTTYSSQRAKQWGNYGCGGQGDNGWAEGVARDHPAKDVTLVRTFEEAAAAIQNGYPVPVCSGAGFASRRDEQGFARRQGSWAHCMVFVGVRYDRPGLLCLNSWGPNWIGGPKHPEDMPDGSFWVDAATCTSMLRGGDSFAVSSVKGFPRRKLRHAERWLE